MDKHAKAVEATLCESEIDEAKNSGTLERMKLKERVRLE